MKDKHLDSKVPHCTQKSDMSWLLVEDFSWNLFLRQHWKTQNSNDIMVKWWTNVNFIEWKQTLMWPEIIPFHAAFAMNALSRRFVNAAAFPFIYYWNCLGVLCCPSFVNCSLVKYVREHWTTYSMSCKYVKWTSLLLFNRSTFFDNKKSSKLVKDVDCLSDREG